MFKKTLCIAVLIIISPSALADVGKANRDKYMKACAKQGMSKSYCACQYNVMNKDLSKKISKDWVSKPMLAKDMKSYEVAIAKAFKQCVPN